VWNEAWPSLTITGLRRSLADVEALVNKPALGEPDEVARALARFLVVRACGYLEQVVDESCGAYITSKSSPQVARHGRSWLGRGANPTPDGLVALVRRFDSSWADDLKKLFEADDPRLHREISLLVDRRNKIAHGLGEGLGARKALDLVSLTLQVADWFVSRFDPR